MTNANFTIYTNPKLGAVKVKTGFSWPAFLFGSLWAAAKRMWFPYFLAMIPIDLALWFISGYAAGQKNTPLAVFSLACMTAYVIIRGRYGNRWLAASLQSRGYSRLSREAAA